MTLLETLLIVAISLEHLYFMIVEMFLWTRPKGIHMFGLKSKEFAEDTKVLAANQGLYNGFLAAGLIYALISSDEQVAIFFLACIIIAGAYGAYSTRKLQLLYVQSVPAIITLLVSVFF